MTSRAGAAPGTLREPRSPVEVALARDESGDRTKERNRSAVIDALRAIAALMVLLDHTSFLAVGATLGPVATAISRMLAAGVYLFFAVSGYLITGPFIRALVHGERLPRVGGYFLRRGARILPGYWVAFLVFLLVVRPVPGVRPYQWPVHLLMLQSIWPHVGEAEAIYGVAWTLGVEIVFYVVVPLVASVLRALHRGPWRPGGLAILLTASGVATIVWNYVGRHHFGASTSVPALIAQHGPQVWWYAFCPGALIALAPLAGDDGWGWRSFRKLSSRPVLCAGVVVLLWTAAYTMERSGSLLLVTLSPPVYVVACGVVLGCAVSAGSWIVPPARVLAPIGLVSYGIYLWHWTVIDFLFSHTSVGLRGVGLPWLLDGLMVLAITLPLATLSWFGIERPLMHRAARWAKRHAKPRSEPAVYVVQPGVRS